MDQPVEGSDGWSTLDATSSNNWKTHSVIHCSMDWLTSEQYQDAISKALSQQQIEVLQTIYDLPNSSATAKELAEIINPASPSPIVASRQVGKIGKAICDHTGFNPPTYFDGRAEKPAYFLMVGEYLEDTGWNMWEELQIALENLGLVPIDDETEDIDRLPTETLELEEQQLYTEGKVVQVHVDRFERSQAARAECIDHYGDSCHVCGFNFGDVYGDTAKGFIHVHHKTPLSDIAEEYEVDPIKDLIPLCANCHSVVHLTKPALTIEELKAVMKRSAT